MFRSVSILAVLYSLCAAMPLAAQSIPAHSPPKTSSIEVRIVAEDTGAAAGARVWLLHQGDPRPDLAATEAGTRKLNVAGCSSDLVVWVFPTDPGYQVASRTCYDNPIVIRVGRKR